jgi:hypothetical protein
MNGDPSMTFAKSKVRDLILSRGGERLKDHNNKEVYLLEDYSIITLNVGENRIEFDVLEEIALEQLEMGAWDFDYWLGEEA